MDNIFKWGNRRRFNSYADYCKRIYGGRLQKLSIDAGLTCPNRDGYIAYGGCIYCDGKSFNPSYCNSGLSIADQIKEGILFHKKRYKRAVGYIAYFQTYSNTYCSVDKLRNMCEEVLRCDGVVGISIGTRADCLNNDIMDYLVELKERIHLMLEIGIESCYEETLNLINRGHSFKDVLNALRICKERGIDVCGHFIFGLPGESKEMIINEAVEISKLPLKSIKIHQFQLIKGTVVESMYNSNKDLFKMYSLEEYVDLVIDFLERLNPNIMIERLSGEVPPKYLVLNSFGLIRSNKILSIIEKRMEDKDTWQGKSLYNV